jgi:hypothetical protein
MGSVSWEEGGENEYEAVSKLTNLSQALAMGGKLF